MAQKLAKQLGLAVGISSGANVIGAIKLKEKMGYDAVVVTVLSDDNKKYLSTDLMKDEPDKGRVRCHQGSHVYTVPPNQQAYLTNIPNSGLWNVYKYRFSRLD